MAAFVTLDEAKDHLRVTISDEDGDIYQKAEQATAIVLQHMNGQGVAGWSDGSVEVPNNVKAATLIVLEDLHEHRPINFETIKRVVGEYPALA